MFTADHDHQATIYKENNNIFCYKKYLNTCYKNTDLKLCFNTNLVLIRRLEVKKTIPTLLLLLLLCFRFLRRSRRDVTNNHASHLPGHLLLKLNNITFERKFTSKSRLIDQCFSTFFWFAEPLLSSKVFGGTPRWLNRSEYQGFLAIDGTHPWHLLTVPRLRITGLDCL